MKFLIISFSLIYSLVVYSQDIHFSQFNTIATQLDPSQTGKFRGTHRAIINYRNQWNSIASPFVTYGAGFDTKLGHKKNFFGIGLNIYNDKAGDINMGTFLFNASLAYHIKTSENTHFSTGIQIGMMQRSIDVSKMTFDSQFNGNTVTNLMNSNEVITTPSFIEPDFAIGTSFHYKPGIGNHVVMNNGFRGSEINIGISAQHVSKPTYSYLNNKNEKQALKYVLYFNTTFGLGGEVMAFQPSGFLAYQQGAYDYVLGTYIRYTVKEKSKYTTYSEGTSYKLGIHYRTLDAIILSAIFQKGYFIFGVSYDINVSGLSVASQGRGGIEFSLSFTFNNPYKNRVHLSRF